MGCTEFVGKVADRRVVENYNLRSHYKKAHQKKLRMRSLFHFRRSLRRKKRVRSLLI
ncbi:hypothetical protein ACE1CA_29885 [Aerosakkonemataceae cyanobacterium BLCC-F167]|uniref:Ribosomal protein S21 n=1 Tax=Floridaenema evergladense BLCC-F167 TaxID=3153639 RepID=A0ABV4WUD2_9CYAN